MAMTYGLKAMGVWTDARGSNMLDTGAHFYDTYETKDGKFVAIGSIEPQFYRELLEKTGITDDAFAAQMDREAWSALKQKLAAVIKTKTRDEWDSIMLGSDVCYAPVLSLSEAPAHPHNEARGSFLEVEGVVQPAGAPRFSATPCALRLPPCWPGEHGREVLGEWGVDAVRVADLEAGGSLRLLGN
jgi:alpha-methylacyl-CoA racemase